MIRLVVISIAIYYCQDRVVLLVLAQNNLWYITVENSESLTIFVLDGFEAPEILSKLLQGCNFTNVDFACPISSISMLIKSIK